MGRYKAYETLPPYEVSESLAPRVKELGLEENFKQMKEDGYTVLRDAAPMEVTDGIREAIVRLAQETEGRRKGLAAGLLVGRDPIFETAILNPKLMALTEYICGQGAQISQVIGSIRTEGTPKLPLHADQNWTPAPFPEHHQLLTACWVCDEFTEENGATKVIPGSHKARRHPTTEEEETEPGAIPIICPKGSIVAWDGAVWHGNYPRKAAGERVVLHITYSRLALRPIEDYTHLPEEVFERNPPEFATMIGRDHFFGATTATSGGADMKKFRVTAAMSKS